MGVGGAPVTLVDTGGAPVSIEAGQVSGLGTAAFVNTGTSGGTVPLLNGASATWANGATFGAKVTASGAASIKGDEGAGTLAIDKAGSVANRFRLFVGNGTLFTADENYISSLNTGLHFLGGATGATLLADLDVTGLDVHALVRCDSFRIDQAPAAGAIVATHTFTININGTDYKVPVVAA